MTAAAAPRPDPRTRRNTELGLLILAVLLALGAYALVGLGKEERVPPGVVGYGVLLAGGYLLAHMVVRRFAPHADPLFLPTAGLLAGLGFAVVYRLDPDRAAAQASWLIFGLGLFIVTLIAIRDHRQLDAYTYTIGLLGVLLLLLPLAPGIGTEIRGARVWVKLGSLQFQPAEIAKVLIVVFAASYLSARRQLLAVATRRLGPIALPEPRHLGPILVAWGVSLAVLFFEKDLGSSLLFFGLVVVMLWVATARGAYLALGGLLFAAGALFAYRSFDHVQDRVAVWLGALDPQFIQDEGFQIAQSLFAMATGGIAGVGLGLGRPQDIPDAPTDFVFAAIGEELGLLGTMAVLMLFVILIARGIRTALARSDDFGRLLAVGLTTILALQTFVIVGGVTRLIPLTGVTLPFVSYGGSSLVANFVLLALLVRVSSVTSQEGR
ncbi:MAG TPA: FtsW/RodA/SpoVE family cell cycle protein [Actinomycetota bacterium]|nr:FtsW/RodA/SpoVE family cell cycle protein [Actinomycetota bacterium]